jgi:predicted CopG family antitoxin
MSELVTTMTDAIKRGNELPIGYHCNSFGEVQILAVLDIYRKLSTQKEKKEFERIIVQYLKSKDDNSRWIGYVIGNILKLRVADREIKKLILKGVITEKEKFVCAEIIQNNKGRK